MKAKIENTLIVECARPVLEDFDGHFDAAEAFVPSEREFRMELKLELENAGFKPWRSRQFKFQPKTVKFLEFDSGNVSHAVAYYEATFTAPPAVIAKFWDQHDSRA